MIQQTLNALDEAEKELDSLQEKLNKLERDMVTSIELAYKAAANLHPTLTESEIHTAWLQYAAENKIEL